MTGVQTCALPICLLGGGIATGLAAKDKSGVLTGAMYRIYGQEGALNGRFHGIVSLLTETASVRIASDRDVEQSELDQAARRMGQPYEFSVSFVDPWPAGTWRLQDIVDYQMIAARSFLKVAARYAEDFQLNRWRMAQDAIEAADEEGPYAWLVRLAQGDPLAAADMVERLRWQSIEIYRAGEEFAAHPAPDVAPLPPPAAPASSQGGFRVQVGAFRSEDATRTAWKRLQGRHKDLLAGVNATFARADLGPTGVVFRRRAGPVASETAARNIGSELAKRKAGCLVVRP